MCIGTHYENIYDHLVKVYADIARYMEKALGKTTFEQNKNYLLDHSFQLMTRGWISERFNILVSLEEVEKTESIKSSENMDTENL